MADKMIVTDENYNVSRELLDWLIEDNNPNNDPQLKELAEAIEEYERIKFPLLDTAPVFPATLIPPAP